MSAKRGMKPLRGFFSIIVMAVTIRDLHSEACPACGKIFHGIDLEPEYSPVLFFKQPKVCSVLVKNGEQMIDCILGRRT